MSAFNRGDWVEAPSGSSGGPPPTEVLVDTFSNRVTNGNMLIDQRLQGTTGTTFASTVQGSSYPVDRFIATKDNYLGISKIAWATVHDLPGFSRCIYWQQTTAIPSPSSVNHIQFAIEATDLDDITGVTGTGNYFNLSFWVKSTVTGNIPVTFRNGQAAYRTYLTYFNVPSIGVWHKVTMVVPSDTTFGSPTFWPNTVGTIGMLVTIDIGTDDAGVYSYPGTNIWVDGDYRTIRPASLPGKVRINSSNHVLRITGVDLRPGQQEVQRYEYHDQLLKCKRFCQPIDINYAPGAIGTFVIPMTFPVEMRILPPNVAVLAAGTLLNASAPTDVMVNGRCSTFQLTTSAANGSILGRRLLLSTGY